MKKENLQKKFSFFVFLILKMFTSWNKKFIFALVNPMTKRHIASWVLLAVYLPLLLFSSLHIHETSDVREAECPECVHHQCHGHLGQLSDGMHQCVLCQFLTISYVATATWSLLFHQPKRKNIYTLCRRAVCQPPRGIIKLRAPPSVWKIKRTDSILVIQTEIQYIYNCPDCHIIGVRRGGNIITVNI